MQILFKLLNKLTKFSHIKTIKLSDVSKKCVMVLDWNLNI